MTRANLLLHNANVVTLDARRTRASSVVAVDGRITWVGAGKPPPDAVPPGRIAAIRVLRTFIGGVQAWPPQ